MPRGRIPSSYAVRAILVFGREVSVDLADAAAATVFRASSGGRGRATTHGRRPRSLSLSLSLSLYNAHTVPTVATLALSTPSKKYRADGVDGPPEMERS